MRTQQEQLSQVIHPWRKNPEEAIRALWGKDLLIWSGLQEILQSVAVNKRTAVRSGHGVGKSWITAKIALTFLYMYYPAKVVTTAPTWFQVEKILWSEIRRSHSTAKFPLGGTLLTTELKLDEDWFAIGLSTREDTGSRAFGARKSQG